METTEQLARQRAGLPIREANQCEVCDRELAQGLTRCTNRRCFSCHSSFCTAGGATSPGHDAGDVVFAYVRKNGKVVSFHNIGGRRLIIKIDCKQSKPEIRSGAFTDEEIIDFQRSANIWNSMEVWARQLMVNDPQAVRFGEALMSLPEKSSSSSSAIEPSIYEELPDPEFFGYLSFSHASKCEAVKIARERVAFARKMLIDAENDSPAAELDAERARGREQLWQKEIPKREAELRIAIAAYDRFRVRHSDELRSLQIASDLGTLPEFYAMQLAEKRGRSLIEQEIKLDAPKQPSEIIKGFTDALNAAGYVTEK